MSKPRQRTTLRTISMVAAFCLLAAAAAAQDSYRVIVHPDNPNSRLTNEEISRIFLKKTVTWPNGEPVEPLELGGNETVSTDFAMHIHGRPPAAIHSYWQERIFSGSAVPPTELDGDDAMVAAVRDHRYAIGYVSANARLTGVKAVEVTYAPRVLSRVPPTYTQRAKDAKIEGEVVLRVLIDPQGKVKEVSVLQPLPYGLTQEAERIVKRWRYQPATRSGQAVEAEVTITVRFHL